VTKCMSDGASERLPRFSEKLHVVTSAIFRLAEMKIE
jgi:hypothetical protein